MFMHFVIVRTPIVTQNGAGKDEFEDSSAVFTSRALNIYGLYRMTTTAFLVESRCIKSDRFACCGEGRVLSPLANWLCDTAESLCR